MAAYPQSVAYTRTFNAYLASDHVSPATGLTIVVTLSKAGGAYAAAGGTVTEVSNGLYKIALTTTDTNTVGDLAIRGAVATMDDVKFIDQVTDPIRGLGAPTAFPGVAAGSNGGLPLVGTQIPNATAGAINGLPVLGANAASLSFTGLTTNILGNLVGTVSTLTTYTGNTPQTGDSFARIGLAGVGLTNLGDTRIANLDAAVTSRLASASYTSPPSAATIAAAVWATVIDGTRTGIQLMRGFAAALLGKASGLDLGTPKYRNIDDTKDVISATTDTNGNRSAITLDLT